LLTSTGLLPGGRVWEGGKGFLLECLFFIALLPAIAVPLGFTLRSNLLNECAARMPRGSHYAHTNPLSQKSGLFFVGGSSSSVSTGASMGMTTHKQLRDAGQGHAEFEEGPVLSAPLPSDPRVAGHCRGDGEVHQEPIELYYFHWWQVKYSEL
jgi:hypothetical protein